MKNDPNKLNEHGYTQAQTNAYKTLRNRVSKNFKALAHAIYIPIGNGLYRRFADKQTFRFNSGNRTMVLHTSR